MRNVDLAGPPICVDLTKPFRGSHVSCIIGRPVGEHAGVRGEQSLQDILGEIESLSRSRPRPQRLAPHHIKRGIDQIGKIAAGRMRIGMDCRQPSVVGHFQQVQIQRMIVGVSETSEVGLAVEMELRHPRQIDGRHHVAVENEKMLRQRIEILHERTGAAQGLGFHQNLGGNAVS